MPAASVGVLSLADECCICLSFRMPGDCAVRGEHAHLVVRADLMGGLVDEGIQAVRVI